MKSKFDELYKTFEEKDEASRLKLANKAASNLFTYLMRAEGLSKEEAFVFILAIIRMFVSYDKAIDQKECDLFNQLLNTNLTLDEFKKIFEEKVDENVIDEIVDSLPNEMRSEVCLLGLAFISSDGKINESEKEIFRKIFD